MPHSRYVSCVGAAHAGTTASSRMQTFAAAKDAVILIFQRVLREVCSQVHGDYRKSKKKGGKRKEWRVGWYLDALSPIAFPEERWINNPNGLERVFVLPLFSRSCIHCILKMCYLGQALYKMLQVQVESDHKKSVSFWGLQFLARLLWIKALLVWRLIEGDMWPVARMCGAFT